MCLLSSNIRDIMSVRKLRLTNSTPALWHSNLIMGAMSTILSLIRVSVSGGGGTTITNRDFLVAVDNISQKARRLASAVAFNDASLTPQDIILKSQTAVKLCGSWHQMLN